MADAEFGRAASPGHQVADAVGVGAGEAHAPRRTVGGDGDLRTPPRAARQLVHTCLPVPRGRNQRLQRVLQRSCLTMGSPQG
jgi:hypothetical protein